MEYGNNLVEIYHFSYTTITCSKGQSSVSTSAYRAADKMLDARTGTTHNFIKNKLDLIHQNVHLPEQAPAWLAYRNKLWNAVERVAKRKDAQLAREFVFTLPSEPQGEIGTPSSPFYQARALEHQQIAQRNGERLLKDPSIAFKSLPHGQSRFSDQDLVQFARRHSTTDEQFNAVYEAIKNHEAFVSESSEESG